MPRKGNVPKRDVLPDPMYGSKVVSKLINNLMIDGKKGKAQTIVYDAFAIVAEKTGIMFSIALLNTSKASSPVFSATIAKAS